MLWSWTVNVMRSKVEPMKAGARLIRKHLEGIVNVDWPRTQQTSGFLEATNSLFQAAKRKARGYASLSTIRTAIFLIAGETRLRQDQPSCGLTHSEFKRA